MNNSLRRLVVILVLLVGRNIIASAQAYNSNDVAEKFQKLESDYRRHELSKAAYLKKADSLVIHFFSSGTYFERAALEQYLSLFKEIAWSEDAFDLNRVNYYEHFMNNALMQSRGGEAIYFSEKVSFQLTGSKDKKSFVELFTKCMFYIKNKNYPKALALYRQEAEEIERYPERLKKGEITPEESMKLMHVLSIIVTPCTELGDTTGVIHTAETALRLKEALLPRVQDDPDKRTMVRILTASILFFRDIFLKEFEKAQATLTDVQQMLENEKNLSPHVSVPADYNLLEWKIFHSLETKDNQRAAALLDRYAAMPSISDDHQSMINTLTSRLRANQGRFEEAYEIIVEAGKNKDKLYASMMNELDQLLYAHTEAEVNRAALLKAEETQKKRTLIGLIIAGLVISGMISVFIWAQNEKKKTKAAIDALNNEANLQIAKLEEEKRQVVRQEQERIGLELHDNLSATMASVLYRLDDIARDLPTDAAQRKVTDLQKIMEQLYQTIRSKSHSWHNGEKEEDASHFREQIKRMTSVLPEDRYTKEIEIENDVVTRLTVEQRVEIFRIIQESVANILKHAKANVVNLFLYNKASEIVLHISDNGKGFDLQKAKTSGGIGLKTLHQRAVKLGGRIEINSDKEGTAIEIIFTDSNHQAERNARLV